MTDTLAVSNGFYSIILQKKYLSGTTENELLSIYQHTSVGLDIWRERSVDHDCFFPVNNRESSLREITKLRHRESNNINGITNLIQRIGQTYHLFSS